MKIAFISDIHGNAVALEGVLEDIRTKNVEKIIVLGDICFRGPEPKRALDLVRSLNTEVIKGNTEEWVCRGMKNGEVPGNVYERMIQEQRWTSEKLTNEDIEYLRNLPTQLTLALTDELKIHAFHATPKSLFDIVMPHEPDEVITTKLISEHSADIFLYGHIHVPYVRFIQGKCVANLGSVGLPFDGSTQSSYAIVEGSGTKFSVSIEKVDYDVEKVVKQLSESDYPNLEFLTNAIRNGAL